MESMRRMDENARYKDTFTSPAMVLRPKALALPPKEMTPAEQRVLPLVDGLRPLRDILAQSKLVEFEVYEALFHLLELGVIEISLGAAPPKVTPIIREEAIAPPARSMAVPVAAAMVAISAAIGIWGTPALYSGAEHAQPPRASSGGLLDDSQRLTLELETYHSLRGQYPIDLRELARDGYFPWVTIVSFNRRFSYQSDGARYWKATRP